VGGFAEDGGVALVFTRTGAQWAQEKKLAGTGAVGKSAPSVALSADGSVIMLGASNDNGGLGAAWVFTRGGNYWTEDKNLADTGAAAKAAPSGPVGSSIMMVGGSNESGDAGAATVSTRRGDGSASQELARPLSLFVDPLSRRSLGEDYAPAGRALK
jgi:hypothetical protein